MAKPTHHRTTLQTEVVPEASESPIVANVFDDASHEVASIPVPKRGRVVVEVEEARPARPEPITPAPVAQERVSEPELPSFFVQDLQPELESVDKPISVSAPLESQPQSQANKVFEAAIPQAFVSEIEQVAQDVKDERKKIIGIIFIIIAILLLSGGLLMAYMKRLATLNQSPVALSDPATPRPIPTIATPLATGSASPASSSEALAVLKKKVKIDVLNGTKTSGLAAKWAAVLKKEGYIMGTVGNGIPDNAGKIGVSTANMALAQDIQKILKDFDFTVTKNEKLTSIQVTLGDPKK